MTEVNQYLQKLGLNDYQSRALATLFDYPDSDAKELSDESGIPYTKIYEVLDSLEHRSLVKYTMGKPKRYRALEPKSVFDTLLDQQLKQAKELKEQEHEILKNFKFSDEERTEVSLTPKAWILPNKEAVYKQVEQSLVNSKKTIETISTKDNTMPAFTTLPLLKAMVGAAKRGVKGRYLLTDDMRVGDIASALLKKKQFTSAKLLLQYLTSKNIEIRLFPPEAIHHVYMIFDSNTIGMAMQETEGGVNRGMLIQEPRIATVMRDYWETMWDKAEPMGGKWVRELKSKIKVRA
ncbi:MAG: helix-turn-helix domain-containing protein [archaeon]